MTDGMTLSQFCSRWANGKIFAIANVRASDGAIGLGNQLMYSNDFRFFKRVTMGASVLVGSKTARSIRTMRTANSEAPLLAGRKCYIASRAGWKVSGPEAKLPGLYIAGGEQIYAQTLCYCDVVYLTKTFGHPEAPADAYFPMQQLLDQFRLVSSGRVLTDRQGRGYVHEVWERNKLC